MNLRFSVLLNYINKKCKPIHWHTSKQKQVQSKEDSFGINSWKQKAAELEKVVNEKTADLVVKNRELEIESALEKVRSRTMAMQKSNELKDVIQLVFDQFVHLNMPVEHAGFYIDYKERDDMNIWLADKHEIPFNVILPYFDCATWNSFIDAKKNGKNFIINYLPFEEKNKFYRDLFKFVRGVREEVLEYYLSCPGLAVSTVLLENVGLYIENFEGIAYTDEDNAVLMRFGKVFQQTYTRFLDLEKAESQTREVQIQLALERVRAKTMAMQKPSGFIDVINVIGEQFIHLGFDFDWVNFSANGLDVSKAIDIWNFVAVPGLYQGATRLVIPFFEHPVFKKAEESIQEYDTLGNNYTVVLLGKKDKDTFLDHLFTNTIYKDLPDEVKTSQYNREVYQTFNVVLKDTWLSLGKYDATLLADEQIIILKRLANEFGQAYTRFLDLQKAEEQARKAYIEAALERVRSHAMAMQSSEELSTLIGTVFTELTKLDLALTRCIIWVFEPATNAARWWMSNSEDPSHPMNFFIKYHEHPAYLTFVKEWKNQNAKFVYDLKGQDKRVWDEILFNETELKNLPDVVKNGMQAPERVLLSASFNNFGGLNVASLEPLSGEHFNLLLRFAKVFDLTYTRFLDLQKAEAQTREAKIEASLEKVRGKAMAMHTSNDLSITSSMIIGELRRLGITPIRCGVGILNKETHKAQLYTATSSADGDNLSVVGWVLLEEHPVLENIYQKWLDGEDYFPELSGDSMKDYYHQLLAGLSVPLPDFEGGQKHYGHFFSVSVGCLYAWADIKYNDEEIRILKRFAGIIDLTFRRYFELQKSEASAKEAVKQAALDRIRADIASMRTVEDLERITPLIWNELTTLGIPFIRCGVFLMDEKQELIHTFLSTPNGKAIAAIHIPYDTPGKIKIIPENWRKKITYTDHWNDPDFIDFANALSQQHAIESPGQYLSGVPHGGFYLHFVPFLQGMMYVGNSTELSEDEINLIQSVAGAFSTAYARYEDFNKLEAAKKQVDSALNELQSTQKQLIQSEKMASLGELTAGIAHEIQNPLNFINNFSELSNELIEELRIKNEELKIEDEEVNDLLNDLTQNLEKINLHGKRADAIVKGMLQHSRTSSGQREPTDVNTLCDEYLRLSYHGLRAKDKNFNADFKTEFGNTIEKINIVPQEIGRVLLNLFNNAFYAVNEKQKSEGGGYVPVVTVATKKENDHVIITVKDNGSGIPEKIKDKIFQPFFTTKPTGQGTGLGLSLAYDNVKACGGEIKVESREGEGARFSVILPAN